MITFRDVDRNKSEFEGTSFSGLKLTPVKEHSQTDDKGSAEMSPKFKDTKMETDENNEKDPNDSKVIDFRKLFNDYKEQTEAGISYTNTHIEDVIFVDQFHVVALEYIYYQIEFEEQKEGEEDQEREQVPIYFGLENEEPESIVDDPKARDTTFSRKSYKT